MLGNVKQSSSKTRQITDTVRQKSKLACISVAHLEHIPFVYKLLSLWAVASYRMVNVRDLQLYKHLSTM